MENMSLKEQISKLGHNILEVRLRAIDNILFKLSVNLIDLNELCLINNGELLKYCIEWFHNDNNKDKYKSMLTLINNICNLHNNSSYIEYFVDKHLPSLLHKLSLKYQFNQNELELIQELITKLISSPQYNNNNNNNINININNIKDDLIDDIKDDIKE
eukprot:405986_1